MQFIGTLLDAITATPGLLFVTVLLLGLIVGSFLNVVILRLPRIMEQEWRRECAALAAAEADPAANPAPEAVGADASATATLSLAHPASHCPHCGHRLRPWENIPVLSWLLLRGRCSACSRAISWRYPAVEVFTALLSLLVVWHFGPTAQAAAALVLTWGLVALAVIDADTQLLPDDLTLPLLWLGLLLSLWDVFADSQAAILGAAAGYLSLWLVFHAFRLLTGKDGMGHGDFKLLALFGAWMGWQTLAQIIVLSAVPGALFGIALLLTGRAERGTPLPFGPFLAISGWVNLLWGPDIAAAYLGWSGLGA
ncbi:A24 family peptidase [uncultured Thiohalocapsa sp.]|uniref:prepilin peptidase n=1 Tax=uncultured Thiohalocapsa sp. TaxID=768990 RepID=UPI0025D4F43B|nr:A24 family peptidase [uncultured Thiohalocapsa sp.]